MPLLDTDARESLLRAAEVEFGRRGVAGARTRAIAAVAGVDQKLIGYHFGGKEALYHAVLRRAAETLAAECAPLADLAPHDAEPALREAIRLVVVTAEQHADLIRVVLRQLFDGSEEELVATLQAVVPPFAAALHLLNRFIDEKAMRPVSHGLIGLAVGAITASIAAVPGATTRLFPGSTSEQRAAMIADILCHGLLPSPSAGPAPRRPRDRSSRPARSNDS